MQAKRLTLAAGVETAFEFDSFFSRSIIVKNMTGGAIQFCDGPFDAAKSAIIPAFGWQAFTVTVPYGEKPKFYVKADVAGDVEIDFGSEMAGKLTGSPVDLRRASADKPLATAVEVGTTFWSVDTDPHAESIEVSNGTTWVVI